MKILTLLIFCSINQAALLNEKPRELALDDNLYSDHSKLYANQRIDSEYQKEVASVMGNVDTSIKNLQDEKYAMDKVLNKTIERQNHYVEYAYKRAAYNIDLALTFLLDRIASIDGGPDAQTYLKDNNYHVDHSKEPEKNPCFRRSHLQAGNLGVLRNFFRYRGVMDKYLKVDAGELIMPENINYQGKVVQDYFEGNGQLFIFDKFQIKGNWKKGRLVKGEIIFKDDENIKYIVIKEQEKQKSKFLVSTKEKNIEIENEEELLFEINNIKYRYNFKVSDYHGLKITLIQTIYEKTLPNKAYQIIYKFGTNLVCSKELIVEQNYLSFEMFANYKYSYTLYSKQALSKVIVYPEGTLFGGIRKSALNVPYKKIMSMPGYYVDIDEFFQKQPDLVTFFPKFSFSQKLSLAKQKNSSLLKSVKEIPQFMMQALEILKGANQNFWNVLKDDILHKNQINFDWQTFDEKYFQKFDTVKKDKFKYENRISKGLIENQKYRDNKFDWDTFDTDYFAAGRF